MVEREGFHMQQEIVSVHVKVVKINSQILIDLGAECDQFLARFSGSLHCCQGRDFRFKMKVRKIYNLRTKKIVYFSYKKKNMYQEHITIFTLSIYTQGVFMQDF